MTIRLGDYLSHRQWVGRANLDLPGNKAFGAADLFITVGLRLMPRLGVKALCGERQIKQEADLRNAGAKSPKSWRHQDGKVTFAAAVECVPAIAGSRGGISPTARV